MTENFYIHAPLDITLKDLGRRGCAHYIFNAAARKRVTELLDVVSMVNEQSRHAVFDRTLLPAWLKTKLTHIGEDMLSEPRSPLEIAAAHPRCHKALMDFIQRDMHWCGVN